MSSHELLELRRRAVERVRALRARDISWDDFMDEFGEVQDPPIADLVNLIEHEPERGGLLGVRESAYGAYLDRLRQAIEKLEHSARTV